MHAFFVGGKAKRLKPKRSSIMIGEKIMDVAIELVLETLKGAPEGLTNVEVSKKTGLSLPIKNQKNYVTYTVLMFLVEKGKIIKKGAKYLCK